MQPEGLKVIIIAIVATALLGASFVGYMAHLKRVAPATSDPAWQVTGADADKRFAKLDGRANLHFVALTACFGVMTYLAFDAMYALRVMLLPPAVMTFPISHAFLVLAAMFAGAGLACMVFCAWARRRWGEDARWYIAYVSVRRYECDYERLCRGLGSALVVLVVLMLPLGLNSYVQVRESGFAIHPFLALREQVHPYSDIDGIATSGKFIAPNGRTRNERDYVVHFKDGTRWVASNLPSGDVYDRVQVAETLARKAGVTIVEVPIFKTSDVYN
jgi:hypothetical protein